MDFEADGRFGNKRVHNRLGPAPGAASSSSSTKVCIHWRAGRCNRFPCPFLHSELPEAATTKRPNQRDGPGGHVWRNPNSGGGGRGGGGFNKWGRGPGGTDGGVRHKVPDRPCKFFLAGDCTYGEKCRYPHTYCMSNSITLLTPLQGHEKVLHLQIRPSSKIRNVADQMLCVLSGCDRDRTAYWVRQAVFW
uniref:C3H1-type domain-containing protein n=1 Tax=Aegilops tauschii subsp. strangulata TaxID=200361 RepID=A0A453PA41_AEGTS